MRVAYAGATMSDWPAEARGQRGVRPVKRQLSSGYEVGRESQIHMDDVGDGVTRNLEWRRTAWWPYCGLQTPPAVLCARDQ